MRLKPVGLILWAAGALAPGMSFAADYPARPIRYVIGTGLGSISDLAARSFAEKLSLRLRQPVVVETKPGGAGLVGMNAALSAEPDGYTIFSSSSSVMSLPALMKAFTYDLNKDVIQITISVRGRVATVVNASSPIRSMADLVAYMKANPGKVNFGSSGVGHADHLAGELFNTLAGVKMQHVAYKGGAPAMTELVGGNIELIFSTVSTAVTFIKAGRIRALAVTSAKRVDLFPDLPTVAEAGVPGFAVDNWYCFIGPRGMPRPVVIKLHRELNRVFELPDVKQRLEGFGIFPFLLPTPEAFGDYIKSESKKYARVVKDAGIRAD